MNPLASITHRATRGEGPYNIVTAPTHERYETGLCNTGHNFFAMSHKSFKTWKEQYAPVPKNYTILIPDSLFANLRYDFVLSQNKFGQFQVLSNVARQLHIPMISLEHTLPIHNWSKHMKEDLRNMRGNINVFISEFSCKEWGFDLADEDTYVIHHAVDTELFRPQEQERKARVLSVVNDWINRDYACGFNIWTRVSKGLPTYVLGDTPGLSKPAPSTEILAQEYAESAIFLNTSTVSPIPTSLLEAMSAGCACVTTATCMIPEIVKNGENGFITNDENELRSYTQLLLKDENLRKQLGENARKTVIEKFGMENFVNNWNNLFKKMEREYYK